ncbi:MAG: hypothetical protein JXA94_01850 [Parachlamydiales bacterium]|nr:hypothetical protein [Parachlamydiales bacterium]
MRKIKNLTILFCLAVIPVFCFSPEYFIEVIDKGPIFQLKVKTLETKNCICPLMIVESSVEPAQMGQDGIINLKITKDPNAKCLMAFGPHRGIFTFRKGYNLPDGYYGLIINDYNYGFLIISDEGVYFNAINCI